jgi:hypothetical protein
VTPGVIVGALNARVFADLLNKRGGLSLVLNKSKFISRRDIISRSKRRADGKNRKKHKRIYLLWRCVYGNHRVFYFCRSGRDRFIIVLWLVYGAVILPVKAKPCRRIFSA